jgi:adenylate kinase family enzyme
MPYQIYIISGVARSGKSILTDKIHKELGYSFLGTDDIRYMIEKRLTDSEIEIDSKERNKIVWPYVESLIKTRLKFGKDNDGFIFEGDILRPSRVKIFKDLPNVHIVCIGYPNISVKDKMKRIRDYKDGHDWTDKLSDEELEQEVTKLIQRSKEFQQECVSENIKFIDVSNYETGIQEAFDFLTK